MNHHYVSLMWTDRHHRLNLRKKHLLNLNLIIPLRCNTIRYEQFFTHFKKRSLNLKIIMHKAIKHLFTTYLVPISNTPLRTYKNYLLQRIEFAKLYVVPSPDVWRHFILETHISSSVMYVPMTFFPAISRKIIVSMYLSTHLHWN